MVQFERAHPWVAERQEGSIRFGVQVFPLADDPNPTESVFAAAKLVEELVPDIDAPRAWLKAHGALLLRYG